MKVSFAPWRMEFITGPREEGCVFCTRFARKQDEKDFILHRGRKCFVILNKYPYNNGHLMVVPYRHVASLQTLHKEEFAEMTSFLAQAAKVLQKT